MIHSQHMVDLKVSNFRGLRDIALEKLASFNLLLGANDVGKTSILEAVFLTSGFPNLSLTINIQNQRRYLVHEFEDLSTIFHELQVDAKVSMSASFGDSTKRKLVITAPYSKQNSENTQGIGANVNGDPVEIKGDDRLDVPSSSSVFSGPRYLHYESSISSNEGTTPITFSGNLTVRDGKIEGSQIPDNLINEIVLARRISTVSEYDVGAISDIIVSKKSDELLKYLRLINPRVEGIAVRADIVHLDIGLKKMIPLNMFGSGMVRAASILSWCILGRDRILLIDEIENGLHYTAIQQLLIALLKYSNERGVQVFATTHSIAVLEELQQVLSSKEFRKHQQSTKSYTLKKDSIGTVRSYKYEYDQFEHCIAQGIEIR